MEVKVCNQVGPPKNFLFFDFRARNQHNWFEMGNEKNANAMILELLKNWNACGVQAYKQLDLC